MELFETELQKQEPQQPIQPSRLPPLRLLSAGTNLNGEQSPFRSPECCMQYNHSGYDQEVTPEETRVLKGDVLHIFE